MPHIKLPDGAPGMVALLAYRPETALPLRMFGDALLNGPGPLSRGERELIATFVSTLNSCNFCTNSHGACAALQLPGGRALVDAVKADYETADLSPKMKALLAIAALVQQSGHAVTEAAIANAREHGAIDLEIHDTVLIAAAYCMFNRYVDGLGTSSPTDPEAYFDMASQVVEHGYRGVNRRPR